MIYYNHINKLHGEYITHHSTSFESVKLYEIEFSDLLHITNLSQDCVGLIEEFCEISWYGNL